MLIIQNVLKHFQRKFHGAMIRSTRITVNIPLTTISFTVFPIVIFDFQNGIKTRGLAFEDLDTHNAEALKQIISEIFTRENNTFSVKVNNKKGLRISDNQMPFAPTLYLYTNRLLMDADRIKEIFSSFQILVHLEVEENMYRSLFISYGGPDEAIVKNINNELKSHGIKTWFFPDDSLPGEKLHRMMSNGIKNHDKVLLVCSENSLTRSGVLNEIERILERESKEGGSEILIPVTLDDYIFDNWKPNREDISDQIKSRVISKIDINDTAKYNIEIAKIVTALKNST